MKTTTTIYRWTAKTSSRCLGRYYTASTLPEAIKAGKEFVARLEPYQPRAASLRRTAL